VRRFTIAPERRDGSHVTFDRDESHHLARVLRLRPGDTVIAVDGSGHDYTVRLERVGEGEATGTILGVATRANPADSWTVIPSINDVVDQFVSSDLYHFTGYAVSW